MAARKAPNIADYFSGAKQTQQLSNAEEEIAQLKTEIERLRASGSEEVETQLSTLKEQLKSQSGVVDLEITQIIQNPDQPRRTFLNESIEAMSQSLASDGQLSPIIVIAQEDENYLLFDGERRWRAAKDLGWSTIKAVTMDEPKDLHRKALLTSLHREDLNPLDKAEAIIKEISLNVGLKADDIPRVLSTVIRRLNKQKRLSEVMANLSSNNSSQNVESDDNYVNESEQAILKILLELQLNPASVDANLLPMLGLADDLKDAIRNLGLKGVHAIALQKLSAKNLNLSQAKAKRLREDLTKKVVQENLSVLQTRKLVNQAIAKYSPSTENAVDANKQLGKIKQSVDLISSDLLRSADPTSLRDVYDLLKQKMTEIESLIS
ncbi:ParB/RepB/Spo0J family partition protein [Pseudanabaena galeata UHCC 0370]|uniref:ParB/RepB/Spo0J family partition protein n=1 Tax=Pseudanabaena galeata UHCC 0370 TaxID=3110310 RepID=A0ABU5TI52_9CYAN|nr:ParB/RepB/Spo0J family partition protein [Pseudanabaena galeata]MEA5477956.1 ParB/RepB/Spo0J family partition protein [Pseudanabaena galeata UHCC 0370]